MSSEGTDGQKSDDLTGIGVLVTRPAHQAETLCELIKALGGNPVRFPALEIQSIQHSDVLMSRLSRMADYDMVIFISPNAVRMGLPLIREMSGLEKGQLIAAVGEGTQRALRVQGIQVSVLPTGRFDSEGLLACEELQSVSGKKILIVRGEGGRALLGNTLRERGATVDYAAVYRRAIPRTDASELLDCWPQAIGIVVTTSIDVLNNLVEMIGERGLSLLQSTPLLVVSPRMEERAAELGCRRVYRASGADDAALLAAIQAAI